MNDLTPRRAGPLSRRTREQRAYRLVVAGSVATAVAVLGLVLALVGVVGFTVPVVAVIVAAVSGLLFRRTVSG